MTESAAAADPVTRVARIFDAVAADYDQSGVAFFGPIAARLCELVDVQPGETVLDVGCGRGAVTVRLAAAAGPSGSVTALDISPVMLEHTRDAVRSAGLGPVELHQMDAGRLTLPERSFDVLAASLVVFFLPDPAAAVAGWLRLLRPGGRCGISTFGPTDETWRAIDALFAPYLPPDLLDPRTTAADGPFGSDASMERLVSEAGGSDVRTVRLPLDVYFEDVGQWRRWTMGTGMRAFWGFVPEDRRDGIVAEAGALLEATRRDGPMVLRQEVRYTLARV